LAKDRGQVPDNGLQMYYGLVPRSLRDTNVAWDDPRVFDYSG